MFHLFKNLALQILLATMLWVPHAHALLQGEQLAEVQRQYDGALGQREALMEELDALEGEHREIVQRIDRLKRQGAMQTIGGRIELEAALRDSKTVADRLEALQEKIRALDTRIAGQRSRLVTSIDARVRDLERSLAKASPQERERIVARLNALRGRRAAYTKPLPSVPSAREVSSALQFAEEVSDHPDELLAAADELQDTEDQLRKRLGALEERIVELRKTRRLVRRAKSFSREERFFEEADRDRIIAKYDRVERRPTRNAGNSGGAQETPTDEQDLAGNNGSQPAFEGEPDPAAADGDDGMTGTPAADFAEGRGYESEVTDSPSQAPVASEPPASSEEPDPFTETRETIVINSGSDPARSVGSTAVGENELDSRIRSLEQEQERLRKQADRLRSRARQLRERAEDL